MSLTDKVIKNTTYYFLAQIFTFIFPLFLTPYIIGKIGGTQFGIYAIVLGFTGTIGLFDLCVSNSFIKFISEHYNRKEFRNLNEVINTGMIFYILFSLVFCSAGFIFSRPLISLLNIPDSLLSLGIYALRISLVIFFVSTSFGIFGTVLISIQKMYLTSIFSIFTGLLNLIAVLILLNAGLGLEGILYSQLGTVSLNIIINIILAKKYLPEIKISLFSFNLVSLKKMTVFGAQMQVSKLSSFASEKYDELLLGFFSVMNNVTFFNISGRVIRFARFIPYQFVPQVAPVAAELNARRENEKLNQLFNDTTKYLTLVSVPVFVYILFFADVIVAAWMGPQYGISAYLLRILSLGQLVNLMLSVPGNSITPNIGLPRFAMYEGVINLLLNLVLSYVLIKNYGIVGAAIGNSVSMAAASLYVYLVSVKYFKEQTFGFLKTQYIKPLTAATLTALILYLISVITGRYIPPDSSRANALLYLLPTGVIFLITYAGSILSFGYLNRRDKEEFLKIIVKILPVGILIQRRRLKLAKKLKNGEGYRNELISFFIITYNRIDFLKKCIESLINTLNNVNYEIIIWDNNSNDGTKEYLRSIKSERIKTVLYDKNIGTNAKGYAAEMCRGDYLVGIDDDVMEFPTGWVEKMVYAYKNIPGIGYLTADVEQNEFTNGAKYPDDFYTERTFDNGNVTLQIGPAGGWCFMLSRDVYNAAGKLPYAKGKIFYSEDGEYVDRLINKGYLSGILKGVKVYHATGIKLNKDYREIFEEKMKERNAERDSLRQSVKRRLSKIFRIRKYYYKFLHYAENELEAGD